MAMPQNFKKPPPRWWRKLEDGLLMIIIPSTVAVIMGWGFKNEAIVAKATLFINTGVVALIKFIGKMLSNGEVYAPEDIRVQQVTLTEKVVDTTEKVDTSKFPDTSAIPKSENKP